MTGAVAPPETAHRRILVVGGGISGLTLAIALEARGFDVLVVDKVAALRAAGSGMSLIGHSLDLLSAIGVPLGAPLTRVQRDVSLRTAGAAARRSRPVFAQKAPLPVSAGNARLLRLPLALDGGLAARHGSIQVNCHRGELQAALLARFGSHKVRAGLRLERCERVRPGVLRARFAGGAHCNARLVVGADGWRSRVRRSLWPPTADVCYAGYCCYRGLLRPRAPAAAATVAADADAMYKTVVAPPGSATSFTTGVMPDGRRFWALDVLQAPNMRVPDVKAHLRAAMRGYSPHMQLIVEQTRVSDIVTTDVYDSTAYAPVQPGVALMGDAAHAVVHHFGQGAGIAIQDAFQLARALDAHAPMARDRDGLRALSAADVERALDQYNAPVHHGRARLLVLISRLCGNIYMYGGKFRPIQWLLRLMLMRPFVWVFVGIMYVLLFVTNRDLVRWARETYANK